MALDKLDLGIQHTQELDSVQAADAFLTGEPLEPIQKEKPGSPKEKTPPAKGVKAPVEEEKEEEEKVDPADAFLSEEEEEVEEENPLEKKKQAAKKQEEPAPETEEEPSNEFQVIAKQLLDLGVFTQETEDEPLPESAEEFAARFQQEKQKGATQWLDQFLRKNGDDRMDLFEAIFINGLDPREYVPAYNAVMDLEGLDLSQEKAQETVYREYYKGLGWKAEKIEAKLQKAKDYGDLEEEAQEMHGHLLEQQKASLEEKVEAKKAADLQKKQADEQYRTSVQGVLSQALKEKELAGLPVSEKGAQELYQFLTRPAYKTPSGELLTEWDKLILDSKNDPLFRARVALYHRNGWDTTKIEKRAVSKETNQLFSGLKKTAVKTKSQKPAPTDNPWAGL